MPTFLKKYIFVKYDKYEITILLLFFFLIKLFLFASIISL